MGKLIYQFFTKSRQLVTKSPPYGLTDLLILHQVSTTHYQVTSIWEGVVSPLRHQNVFAFWGIKVSIMVCTLGELDGILSIEQLNGKYKFTNAQNNLFHAWRGGGDYHDWRGIEAPPPPPPPSHTREFLHFGDSK